MLPRGSVFRELRGYLPGPLPANKWSRRPTMMNCEFGSSPVCLQLPASVPASIESVMLNQLKVTVSYRHPRRRGVPRGVHRRRGGGYHRVGGPGRGRGVGDPPLRSPPSGSGWGEGGSRPPSSCPVQNTPHGAFARVFQTLTNTQTYFLPPLPAKLPGRIFEPPSFGAAAWATFRRRRRA